MSLKMLINATRSEEVRAAIVRDGVLEVLEIDAARSNIIKGNVYKGKVANVEGSLNACFVEIGTERQGFMPSNDIVRAAYHEKPRKEGGRPRIEDVIKRGRDVVVQVTRDAVGSKGPALTTDISLAGRFLVLMPHDSSRGISRKIEDEKQRKQLKELASKLTIPEGMGFIIRTAGEQVNKTALNRDLAALVKLWKKIDRESGKRKSPALLHQEGDLVERMIRDYYSSDFDELIVDTEEAFQRVQTYFKAVMPRTKANISLHRERAPLFTHLKLEAQIETIHERKVQLPSGASIVIDPTEALIAIDVNSGKSTRQRSQEETAVKTNLEAAAEIARQLRLRDLGGLVVVDFIDMASKAHNRKVEKAVKAAVKPDKARVYLGRISDNGLMEINRQRIKQSLQVRTHRECPTCSGAGAIPSPEFVAMQIIRHIDARAASGNLAEVHVDLHPELADFLQNHCRNDLAELERDWEIRILVAGRPGLHRNEQNVSFNARPSGGKKGKSGSGRSRGGRGRSRTGGAASTKAPTAARSEGGRGRGRGRAKEKEKEKEKEKLPEAPPAGKDAQPAAQEAPADRPATKDRTNDAQPKEGAPARSRSRGGRRGRGRGGAARKDTEANGPAPEGSAETAADDGGEPRLTKSQKRRQRRKRKRERERMGNGGEEMATSHDAPLEERTDTVEDSGPGDDSPGLVTGPVDDPVDSPVDGPVGGPEADSSEPPAKPGRPSVMQLLREMVTRAPDPALVEVEAEQAPPDEPQADEPQAGEPPTDEPQADEPHADEPPADEPTLDDKPELVLVEPPEPKPKPKRARRSRGSRGRSRGRGKQAAQVTAESVQLDLVGPPTDEFPALPPPSPAAPDEDPKGS